jgi:hypothetical protein
LVDGLAEVLLGQPLDRREYRVACGARDNGVPHDV